MPRFIVFCLLLLFACTINAALPDDQITALQTIYDTCGGSTWGNGWVPEVDHCAWSGVTCNDDQNTVVQLDCTFFGLACELPDINAFVDLEYLDLTVNQLSGIPDFDLPKLTFLGLNTNLLSGEIPDFDLPKLIFLDLSFNQLSGEIPYFVLPDFDLPELQILDLQSNQLSGEIPDFDLPELQSLNLGNNQLSGEIPDFDLPELQTLILHTNLLSGEVPNFDLLPSLSYVMLVNNHLCGILPNFQDILFELDGCTFLNPAPSFCEDGSCGASFDDAAGFCCAEGSYPDPATAETCLSCRDGCAICHDGDTCDLECDAEIGCHGCPDGSVLWDDDMCHPTDEILTEPVAALTWSLYYNGCIAWDATLFGPEEEGTFTLHSGGAQLTFASGVPLIDGQYNWNAIYGVLPSTSATIEAVFGTRDPIFTPQFTLAMPVEAVDNPCLSI